MLQTYGYRHGLKPQTRVVRPKINHIINKSEFKFIQDIQFYKTVKISSSTHVTSITCINRI